MVRKKKQRRSDAVRQKTETAGSHRYSNVIAGMLLIGSFVLYLRNLCPTIYAGDSPTFSASAWLLGVSHPPGYPLFSVLGKLFCVLPLGDIGFRTNLGTAVLGSGAVAGMYFLGKNLGINRFWSGFAATLFAVTRVFWDQCLGAEVYTLHALLTVLVLSMLFSKLYFPRKVAAIAFLLGVSMTNHFMSLFLFAASGLWLVLEFMSLRETFPGKNILTGLKASFFLFLGLSLYLYLPLRAIHQPGINWGAPDTYEKTRDHITRKQYKQLEFGSPFTPDQIEKKYQERKDSFQRPDGKGFYSLAESKKAIEQIMLWEAKDKFLGHFFSELSSQFAWILVIPGLFGLYQLMKIRPREISSMA
ncbi:MAG: DUF2723 domain-containing protein, partial [bacterium]|nr:DUF2723 domain-containing protein [bacterium]